MASGSMGKIVSSDRSEGSFLLAVLVSMPCPQYSTTMGVVNVIQKILKKRVD